MAIQVYCFGILEYEFDSGDSKQDLQDAKHYITGCGLEWCIKHKCEETDIWSKQLLETYDKSSKK